MFKELDPLLHSQLRLAIMSVLISVKEAEFSFLREKTQATAGNGADRSGHSVRPDRRAHHRGRSCARHAAQRHRRGGPAAHGACVRRRATTGSLARRRAGAAGLAATLGRLRPRAGRIVALGRGRADQDRISLETVRRSRAASRGAFGGTRRTRYRGSIRLARRDQCRTRPGQVWPGRTRQ